MDRRECVDWIEANIPKNTHAVDAQGKLSRMPAEVTLVVTRGITNNDNMVLARGVGAIRNLEELYAQERDRANRAEDALARVKEIVDIYTEIMVAP